MYKGKEITVQFPLSGVEITLWLGATAVILLITSEIISPWYGQLGLLIDKRKLRRAGFVFLILFLLVVFAQIYEIFTY